MTQPKRPWWQITTTPKWGFMLGGLWLVLAAGQWWRLASDLRDGSWTALRVILPVLSTLLATVYLVSAMRLRRRLRGARARTGRERQ